MKKRKLYKKSYVFGGKVKHYIKTLSKESDKSKKDIEIKVKVDKSSRLDIQKERKSKRFFPSLNFAFSTNLIISMFMLLVFSVAFLGSFIYFKSQQDGEGFRQSLKTTVVSSVKSLNDTFEPNIPKFENRYTTFLLLGVDSRNPVIEDGYIKSVDGFKDINTDTMMQIVYDHENNSFFMISIPRDMGHSYEDDPCLYQFNDFHPRNSINHVYKLGYMGECPGGGIGMLKDYIEDITGFPVHYHAIVHLESFLDVIDIIGDERNGEKGLYMDIPEAISSWYPNEYTKGYNQVYIPAGSQFLTSEEVLYYARVRIGYDDYHRARRQQLVIDTIKDKVLEGGTFNDPVVVGQFINRFKDKMVFSEFTLDDIRAGVELYDNLSRAKVYKITLDNKIGGLNQILMAPDYSSDGNHRIFGWYLIPTTWTDDSIDDKFIYVKNYIRDEIENSNETISLE